MSKSKSKTAYILDKIDTGISRDNLQKIANILNDDLADEYVLLTKMRNYHWSVEDPRFNDLHKFFEEQYELISASVDEIAESKGRWWQDKSYIERIHKFFSNRRRCRFVS